MPTIAAAQCTTQQVSQPGSPTAKTTEWILAGCGITGALIGVATFVLAVKKSKEIIRQLSTARFDVARDLVRKVVKVRETIRFVRNPWSNDGIRDPMTVDGVGRKPPAASDEPEKPHWRQMVDERRKRYNESFVPAYRAAEQRLDEAEALLDVKDLRPLLVTLLGLANRVALAVWNFEQISEHCARRDGIETAEDVAEKKLARQIFNDDSCGDRVDEFTRELTDAVEQFKRGLRHHIGL